VLVHLLGTEGNAATTADDRPTKCPEHRIHPGLERDCRGWGSTLWHYITGSSTRV
jgi:hypothetical protein